MQRGVVVDGRDHQTGPDHGFVGHETSCKARPEIELKAIASYGSPGGSGPQQATVSDGSAPASGATANTASGTASGQVSQLPAAHSEAVTHR